MGTEIQVIYTATRALVSPGRDGTEQSLTFEASQNDPPMQRVKGRTQFSRRGLRKKTTVHGKWFEGDTAIPYIRSDQRPFWREYLESTEEEEPHRLIHPDYLGWDADVNDLSIYRPINSGVLKRIDGGDVYRATIRWRQVES